MTGIRHATLDFYVLCRLADPCSKDGVGHASSDFVTSWLCNRFFLYPEPCWTCRVGLFYVQCRLHYSEMSGHAQNNVGHAMLDFFTSPAVFTARWSIFACPKMLDMPSWTYALCRLHNLPKMSVHAQNRVRKCRHRRFLCPLPHDNTRLC